MQNKPDLAGTLEQIFDRARKLLHADSIVFLNREGEVFVSGEPHSLHTELAEMVTKTGLNNSIYEKGAAYLQNESQYREFISSQGTKSEQNKPERDFWLRERIQSLVCIRVGEEDDPVGVMMVNYRTPQNFDSSTMELIEAFSFITGFAILNHRLLAENFESWEQQRQASFALSVNEIISSMAHNSGNLLFSLNMRFIRFADRVRKSKANQIDKQSVQDFLKDIEQPLTELSEDFSRLKEYRNLERLVVESCKIEDLIERSLLMLNAKFENKRIAVTRRYSPTPKISCDKNSIQHVLLNLLLNAADAIGHKGLITIETDVKEGYVRILIADNGSGISPEDRARIFEPFFTKKHKAGSGMGLPISRYIVRNHGGKIEFTSTINKGTTFYVYLPIG